jgi:hypothetical protein
MITTRLLKPLEKSKVLGVFWLLQFIYDFFLTILLIHRLLSVNQHFEKVTLKNHNQSIPVLSKPEEKSSVTLKPV